MSDNSLGWVFPAAGEDIPPTISEVNYGPIHYKDSIILEFTPKSYTGDIKCYCDWSDSQQGNVWSLTNTGSPLLYHFNQTTPNAGDLSDYHACHFFFSANTISTSSGNTQAFQYINNASVKAVTWSLNGSGAAATTSTSTTSSSSSTSSQTSTTTTTSSSSSSSSSPTTLSTSTTSISSTSGTSGTAAAATGTSAPQVSAVSQPSGLSGGAIAGIVIGVLAILAIIAGLGFFFGRRARRNNNNNNNTDGPLAIPANSETKPSSYPAYENGASPQMAQTQNWTTDGGKSQPARFGELQGQPVSELDTRVVHEIGEGQRMELPG